MKDAQRLKLIEKEPTLSEPELNKFQARYYNNYKRSNYLEKKSLCAKYYQMLWLWSIKYESNVELNFIDDVEKFWFSWKSLPQPYTLILLYPIIFYFGRLCHSEKLQKPNRS